MTVVKYTTGIIIDSLAPLPPSHVSYNDETWHSNTLPKEDSNNI